MTLATGAAGVGQILSAVSHETQPVIAAVLAPHLGGLAWTMVLSELDRAHGRPVKSYDPQDIQCQLRVLTERLGNLGFPFDDRQRSVSTVAGELRIVRNRWAHLDDFDDLDLWRAADFGQRLLEELGASSETLAGMAAEALSRLTIAVAQESSTSCSNAAAVSSAMASPGVHQHTSERMGTDTVETVTAPQPLPSDPAPASHARRSVAASLESFTDSEFSPWQVVARETGVVEALPTKVAKEKVRATAAEIIEVEGPVAVDRVATLVARTYGINRLADRRRQQIIRQIRAVGLLVDADGFA